MRTTKLIVLLLFGIMPSVAFSDQEDVQTVRPSSKTSKPNVVYILADDLGYGELGSYGQELIQTPNIDRLAQQGMRMTQHYSGSTVCAPSRCVLLTGMHTGHSIVRDNWENGGWGPDQPEGQYPLPSGTETLARQLQAQGYRTSAIGKWGLGGPGTSGHPNQQGFDHFYGYLCQRKAHNYYPTHLWRNSEKIMLEGNDYFKAHQKIAEPLEDTAMYERQYAREQYAPDLMIDEAVAFIKESGGRPFFLYYPSPIPHVALQVPEKDLESYPESWDAEPYLGQKGYLPHLRPRAAYAAMITRLDTEVGKILDQLEAQGIADNTIVIFSSDNGPTYAGGVDYDFFNSAGGLRGLKGSLWEGGIRVPMIARWPGKIPANETSDHVSGFQDVMPTVLELVDAPAAKKTDGVSFAAALQGEAQEAGSPFLYWERNGRQAVRMGQYKAVRTGMAKGKTRFQLFDLELDPAETTDISKQLPEVSETITKIMDQERTVSAVFPMDGVDPALSPDA